MVKVVCKLKKIVLMCVCMVISLASYVYSDIHSIEGRWLTKDDEAIVEIYNDPEKNVYNGKIVWLTEPNDENNNDKVDNNNPDPLKRNQKRIGLIIAKGFTYIGNNKWGDGKMYDPENGKTYSGVIKVTEDDTLKLRGYIGISLIGRTEVWHRADTQKEKI